MKCLLWSMPLVTIARLYSLAELVIGRNSINDGRADLYLQAAARNGVSVAAAGAAAYEQVVSSRLRPGEYYQTPDGSWRRK